MSGFCVSAARLAMPDAGLIRTARWEDVGGTSRRRRPRISFIGDADDGYGNAMNAKRTVRGYASRVRGDPDGTSALQKRAVTPPSPARDEAVARVRAACDERDEGPVRLFGLCMGN